MMPPSPLTRQILLIFLLSRKLLMMESAEEDLGLLV
jgi:hypothetical protein